MNDKKYFHKLEKWIREISQINDMFKLKFNGSKLESKSVSWCVIRYSNGVIKMVVCRHLGNS